MQSTTESIVIKLTQARPKKNPDAWLYGWDGYTGSSNAGSTVAVTKIPLTVEFMRQLFVFLIRYTIYGNYRCP